MISPNDLKVNIINTIIDIEDLDRLTKIYENLEQTDTKLVKEEFNKKTPNINDAIVEIREGISFQQILQEQGYRPITYKEFRALADEIKWEHSLEEMLAALD